ncbi:MAG: hypothetical protein ACI9EW_004020, partial [Cellvibrionaceae bacterium]
DRLSRLRSMLAKGAKEIYFFSARLNSFSSISMF